MNKQKSIILILLVLFTISLYFGFFRDKNIQDVVINQLDTNEVSYFSISFDTSKVEVSRQGGNWMVDNHYHANIELVKRLFRVIKNLETDFVVTKDSIDYFAQELKKNGTKLQFFDGGSELGCFWIGNFSNAKKSTLLMNEDEIPVYASSPGLTSDIEKFVVADDIFWRDKRIFDFYPEQIKSIELTDYQLKNKSFKILADKQDYSLFDAENKETDFSVEAVARYISYYRNIRFESVAEESVQKQLDSLSRQEPLYKIKVGFSENGSTELSLFQKRTRTDQPDLNQAYVLLNNKAPLVVVSYFIVDPLLKNIDYFKPGEQK